MNFGSPVVVDGTSQPGAVRNTLASGTNAIFVIRATRSWKFSSGAFGSVVKGIEFREGMVNEAPGLRVLGNLFGGDNGGIVASRQIFVGSTLRADRNRFESEGRTINFVNSSSSNSVVVNNIFGRSADLATVITNAGIRITGQNANNIVIGGVAAAEANVFSGGELFAVRLESDASGIGPQSIRIRGNSFAFNAQGIDLAPNFSFGVTRNDIDDVDAGSNNLQNFPVINTATVGATGITISGLLDRPANQAPRAYNLDFYVSATCNGSGFGDGDVFFGTHRFLSTGPTDESFNVTIPTTLIPTNAVLTATATEVSSGNTSAFSACVVVAATEFIFRNGFD